MSAIQKMPATLSICVCLNKKPTHTHTKETETIEHRKKFTIEYVRDEFYFFFSLFNFVTLFIIQVVVPHSWFVTYRFRLYSLKKKKYNFFKFGVLKDFNKKDDQGRVRGSLKMRLEYKKYTIKRS